MSEPSDPRDETVPATQVAPISFAEHMCDVTDKLRQRAYRAFGVPSEVLCATVMGSAIIRDDSTPPASPNSGQAAPIDGDAWE